MNVQQLENELWEAADQLRANSKLTAAEYSMPVLGLIFLRHADNRFKAFLPETTADEVTQAIQPAQDPETGVVDAEALARQVSLAQRSAGASACPSARCPRLGRGCHFVGVSSPILIAKWLCQGAVPRRCFIHFLKTLLHRSIVRFKRAAFQGPTWQIEDKHEGTSDRHCRPWPGVHADASGVARAPTGRDRRGVRSARVPTCSIHARVRRSAYRVGTALSSGCTAVQGRKSTWKIEIRFGLQLRGRVGAEVLHKRRLAFNRRQRTRHGGVLRVAFNVNVEHVFPQTGLCGA